MSSETVLDLDTIKLPVGSDRGISQDLGLINPGALRRTVNGTLLNTTRSTHKKFQTQISGSDQTMPAISGIAIGDQITVKCISILSQWVAAATVNVTLARTLVTGSVTAETLTGTAVTVTSASGTSVVLASNSSGCVVKYRPSLTMRVTDITTNTDEFGASVGWTITAEEV